MTQPDLKSIVEMLVLFVHSFKSYEYILLIETKSVRKKNFLFFSLQIQDKIPP